MAASGNNLQRIQDNYFPCGALVPNLICVGSTTRCVRVLLIFPIGDYSHVLAIFIFQNDGRTRPSVYLLSLGKICKKQYFTIAQAS